MRLAVVSDIHGNLPALEAVLAEIGREHVDRVVNLGDIVSGPLWPRETAALLRALAWPTIRGNHERQLLALPADRMGAADAFARARLADDDLHWLAALPATLDLGDGVWCCHGTPASDLQYFLETVTPDLGRDGSPGVRAATAAEVADRLGAVDRAAGAVRPHPHAARGAMRRHAGRQPRQRGPAGLRRRAPARAPHGNRQPARALGAGEARRKRAGRCSSG